MSETSSCVSCGQLLTGAYCAACGERAPHERSRTLREFLADATDALTNINGKLIKSLRLLLFRPGLLSAENARGASVPYMRPVQLFLVANLGFFLLSFIPIFSTPLQVHTWSHGFPHRATAEAWVRKAVAPDMEPAEFRQLLQGWWRGAGTTGPATAGASEALDDLGRRFNARVELQGRTLIVLMVPMFALWPGLLNFRRRPHAIDHLVFATHFMSVLLLAALASMWTLRLAGASLGSLIGLDAALLNSDALGSLVLGVLLATWLALGVRRFYHRGWLPAVVQALVLVTMLMFTVQAFRALLFFTTWWSLR